MDISGIKKQIKKELEEVSRIDQLRDIEKRYLGREGVLTRVLRSLKTLSQEERKIIGKEANDLKEWLIETIKEKERKIKEYEIEILEKNEWIDISAPGKKVSLGHLHPITLVQWKVEDIFQKLGFSVVEGPQIETEWYNFDALNIPRDHPARDMWDTFWLQINQNYKNNKQKSSKIRVDSSKLLLRTHTSPVQIHYMEKNKPPLRIIAPGRIFRYEATDASHEINFYQVEGLMVDKEISVANFSHIIHRFFEEFLEEKTEIRLRPSFFPFTEPSFEVDVQCSLCGGKGCRVCSYRGWIEVAGAGMVHPNVFKAVGINPDKWQGFAFGIGLDRLAMMKYKVNDIRLFYSGDLRFLKQF